MAAGRVAWIDHAKGLGILLVILMASVAGPYSPAEEGNWMAGVAAWAAPITLPAFFLIAGLFLHRSLFGSRTAYFDRKVLHFAWFFAVWLAIGTLVFHASAIFANPAEFVRLYLAGWVAPQGPLWFIHELALFYIVTRLVRRMPVQRLFVAAVLLQLLHAAGLFQTGWAVVDRFAAFYVFFLAGYAGVALVFRFARAIPDRAPDMVRALAVWFGVHTLFVAFGIAGLPLVSLTLGFAGAFAIVAAGVMLSWIPAAHSIGEIGRHSLAVYLGFWIPMHLMQAVLSGGQVIIIPDPGTASLMTAAAALAISLGLYRRLIQTPLRVLYVRPRMLRLRPARSSQRGSLLSSAVPEA